MCAPPLFSIYIHRSSWSKAVGTRLMQQTLSSVLLFRATKTGLSAHLQVQGCFKVQLVWCRLLEPKFEVKIFPTKKDGFRLEQTEPGLIHHCWREMQHVIHMIKRRKMSRWRVEANPRRADAVGGGTCICSVIFLYLCGKSHRADGALRLDTHLSPNQSVWSIERCSSHKWWWQEVGKSCKTNQVSIRSIRKPGSDWGRFRPSQSVDSVIYGGSGWIGVSRHQQSISAGRSWRRRSSTSDEREKNRSVITRNDQW